MDLMIAPTVSGIWTLTIPAPARMYSANSSEHWRRIFSARKAWRDATFVHAQQARLPKHLTRVRIDIELHFTNASRQRDTANYHPTVGKPIVDALGRGRIMKGRKPRVEVGYELIPNDTPDHLDGPHLTIGAPVDRRGLPLGLAVVTITDLTGGDSR